MINKWKIIERVKDKYRSNCKRFRPKTIRKKKLNKRPMESVSFYWMLGLLEFGGFSNDLFLKYMHFKILYI